MSIKITYLDKYSIAPPPSRDYYGLRVHEDEVKLFHWRISHGPHKIPFTHISNYIDWENNKLLQSEIERIFGGSYVQYTNDIILNRRSLLTLPKNFIEQLLGYLPQSDIFKLLLLCRAAYEILNTDRVWKLLCKRIKGSSWRRRDEEYGMAYGWRQLYKETKDIEKHLGASKTSKSTISNGETKQQRTLSQHKLSPKPKLEIIRTTSVCNKDAMKNLRRKIEPRTEDNNCMAKYFEDGTNCSSTPLDGRAHGRKNFLNIVNLQADDLDLTSNTKQVTNSFEAKAIKKNILDKQKIPKFSTTSKSTSAKVKTNTYGKVKMSRSTILGSKSYTVVNHSSFKSDEFPLDDLVKHAIEEEYEKPNEMLECAYNWFDGISTPKEQSNAAESTRKYDCSFITNKYKAARESVYDSFKLTNDPKSPLILSQMSEKITELSAWQAAKLKALKASKTIQSSTPPEKIVNTHSSGRIPHIRRNFT